MMYAECTRTALVFLSHASTILMGFRLFGILKGKFMKILVTWDWRTVTRMVKNIMLESLANSLLKYFDEIKFGKLQNEYIKRL